MIPANIRAGIGDRLDTITGFRVYDHMPEAPVAPCGVVALGDGLYDEHFDDDSGSINWIVLVLVSRADDVRGQGVLDTVVATSGTGSVTVALRGDPTLGGTVDTSRVVGWSEPRVYDIGGTPYLGLELEVNTQQ